MRSPKLAALPDTATVRQVLAGFMAKVDARTLRLDDYGVLLANLTAPLHRIANSLGAGATLNPLIDQMVSASTARARQKAHRDFLLGLQQVA